MNASLALPPCWLSTWTRKVILDAEDEEHPPPTQYSWTQRLYQCNMASSPSTSDSHSWLHEVISDPLTCFLLGAPSTLISALAWNIWKLLRTKKKIVRKWRKNNKCKVQKQFVWWKNWVAWNCVDLWNNAGSPERRGGGSTVVCVPCFVVGNSHEQRKGNQTFGQKSRIIRWAYSNMGSLPDARKMKMQSCRFCQFWVLFVLEDQPTQGFTASTPGNKFDTHNRIAMNMIHGQDDASCKCTQSRIRYAQAAMRT